MRYQENLCNNCPECMHCGLKYENAWVFECDNCDCTVAEEDLVEAPDGSDEEWCKACVNQYEEEQREAELNEHVVDAFEAIALLKNYRDCTFDVLVNNEGVWSGMLIFDDEDKKIVCRRSEDYREVLEFFRDEAMKLWKEAENVSKG